MLHNFQLKSTIKTNCAPMRQKQPGVTQITPHGMYECTKCLYSCGHSIQALIKSRGVSFYARCLSSKMASVTASVVRSPISSESEEELFEVNNRCMVWNNWGLILFNDTSVFEGTVSVLALIRECRALVCLKPAKIYLLDLISMCDFMILARLVACIPIWWHYLFK